VKDAGRSSVAKKFPWSRHATDAPQVSRFSREDSQNMNRQALAVINEPDAFDESGSSFFAPEPGGITALNDEECKFLDSMIEKRGLVNVLKAVQALLESRVEEGVMQGGSLMLHLSRDDAFARAAERLQDITFHPDIKGV
jgi:hypothetical protein